MFPKMPGQMVMGQQGAPVMGQHPGMMAQGGMPLRMPQGQPFIGGAQPQHPAALGANVPRVPGPGAPPGFFPQAPGMPGADPRILQERQLQHRMQMAKLQQQQAMMGQQPMPQQVQHPNQQAGLITQPQPAMMGNQLMVQQQANCQQGMHANQTNQQSMVQVQQGMVPSQSQQNLVGGQLSNHSQVTMAPQRGVMGNHSAQQLRPQLMMAQQGMVGAPRQPGLRGPRPHLIPQQQNILAQRMLASQQQQNNLNHLQQQQMSQQNHPAQMISQSSQEQEGPSQPSTPQIGSPPSAGSNTPQQQGSSENSGSKEGGILSPESRTPQHSGPPTPIQMSQQASLNENQSDISQQQQHQNQVHVTQHHPQSAHEQQAGMSGNVSQEQLYQVPLTQQRQASLSADKPALMTIKEEGKPADFIAQQKSVQNAAEQSHGSTMQQQVMGQNHPGQPQSAPMGLNPQQQALMAQQKQQAMMGMMRAQQQGMMMQRPMVPPGQIRTPINIQAILAQNPQLRNLPQAQQIQHIQAIIAQRHLHQGQMLRMSVSPGQPGQMRPQVPPVGQQMMGMEGRHLPYGGAVQPGAPVSQQASGMFGQQPNAAPQMQQEMMIPVQQPPQTGEMMQPHMRDQVPRSPMDQSRMMSSASPRNPLTNSPGDPRHTFNQAMRSPTPNQNKPQTLMAAAGGRVQGSPSHAYSPRVPFGMSPVHPSSPHSSHVSSPSGAGRGSPYSQVKASPLRSPESRTPFDCPSLKTETSGSEASKAASLLPNGLEKGTNVQQQLQQGPEAQAELCRLTVQNIKQEPREVQCDGAAEASPGAIKREAACEMAASENNTCSLTPANPESQGLRSETGQQLLQKLLKTKNIQLTAPRPSEGIHSEINGHINSKLAMLEQKLQGTPRNMEVFLYICNISFVQSCNYLR